jgi:RNA polymerase sigma-70 factor, ECF subfamily
MIDRTATPPPAVRDALPEQGACESVAMGLAREAAAGDIRATRQLLELVGPRLAAVARVVLGPAHPDADDALQQSLIAFVQALPNFRGECEPTRFAARIAVRTALAERKRARARQVRHDDLVDPDAISTWAEAVPVTDMAERRGMLVRQLLETLPEEQAESLALRVVLGWTLDEVAGAMGVPVNTVRSRVRLAKEAMRRRIKADPVLCEILGAEE